MDFLVGYRTYVGATILLLTGLRGLALCIPGVGDEPCDFDGSVQAIAAAIGLFGLRKAL